jgi:hypothetical protein
MHGPDDDCGYSAAPMTNGAEPNELTTLRARVKELEGQLEASEVRVNSWLFVAGKNAEAVEQLQKQNALLTLEVRKYREALEEIGGRGKYAISYPHTIAEAFVVARNALDDETPDTIALDAYVEPWKKDAERLREALFKISEGDVGRPRRVDQCRHGIYGFENCEACYQEFAEKALTSEE